MKPVKISSKLLRELLMDQGANGINDAIKNYTSKCISNGVGPATTAALAAGGASALPFIGVAAMILGPILWDVHKDKKDAKQKEILGRKLDQFQEVVDRMAGDASNAANFSAKTDRMLEELIDGKRPVWARLNGLDKQQIADKVTEETRGLLADMFETIGAEFPKVLDHLGNIEVLSFDTNFRLRRLETTVIEGFDRIESQLPAIADLQEKLLKLAEANADLAIANTSLHEQLVNANRELAEQRLAAGRSVDEVLAELRETDPLELFAFLQTQVDDDEAEYEKNRAKLIARHREIATIGFPLGKVDEAKQSLERLLELIPNDLGAINRLGHIHRLRGELCEAQSCYQRVLDTDAEKNWQAAALGNLGLIEQTRGNLDGAEGYHKHSLSLNTELGHKEGMANQLGNLGLIERIRGNLDEAEGYHKQSLDIEKELERQEGMASQLGNLGLIEEIRGNLDEAEGYHKQSLAIATKLGRLEGMAIALGNLGLIERIRGNLDEAEGYLKQSLDIEKELGHKEGMAIQLGNLGLIEGIRGNLDEAEGYLKQSLDIATELGHKEGMAIQLGNLGLIEWTRGNFDEAEGYLKQSLDIDTELGHKEGMANQLANFGLIEQKRGNLDVACKLWRQSLALYKEIGAAPMVERVKGWLAEHGGD